MSIASIPRPALLLGAAGLLKGYRCTIHWEDRDTLLAEFPDLLVSSRLFEIDRDRYTCSGGVSPLDLMTFVLRRPPGSRALAQQVSDLLVSTQRSPDENQSLAMRYRYANVPELLLEALEIMESNVEEPLSPSEIADYLKISRRQLERQFREFLNTGPARKYLEIRLARARLSVLRTSRRIDEIASACGFASAAHFIGRYRAAFGNSPQAERKALLGARQ
ncbi:MAG: helix-turn-helix domain-containing protein [Burkholderiales bacterium]|nr:helix-turn-helix domain-containing protein [Burkholderiales bacterium]